MNFVQYRKPVFIFSGVMVALSALFLLVPGLNLGVDFTGGTILERQTAQNVTTAAVRRVLDGAVPEVDLSGAVVQILDLPNQFVVRTRELSNADIIRIDQAFQNEFGSLVELRTDVVGPVIGRELVRNALIAIAVSALGILAYVSWRFEYRFAAVAVACLLHDVLIVLGFFAITGREVNSPFVAAALTVLGYSINNTIVVFDRVRENLRSKKKQSGEELVNQSLNQTLTRSLNTSITTLLVIVMLVIFGGSAIGDFAVALLFGVLLGTYSSLFVAAPLWLTWMEWKK
ncbi:MAG: protein translocase subunit SecF [Bacillota bacterium]|jgi:preprotein translocase subunit SecF|nr:protein translocase subunit SecF [Bacillota bacterium]HHT90188.1 protein translocase subunit SecF [Bacillota bacterium]